MSTHELFAQRSNTTCVVSTGNRVLDEIMCGGFLVRNGAAPAVLIAGEPGCGKSTLGMHLACHALQHNSTVLVVTVEEKPSDADFLAASFSLLPNQVQKIFDPVSEAFPDKDVSKQNLSSVYPTICYSFFPDSYHKAKTGNESLADCSPLYAHLKTRISILGRLAAEKQVPKLAAVLLDSLPILSTGIPTSVQRGVFKSLCELVAQSNAILIMVAEQFTVDGWRDFVADIVIHLGWGHDEISGNGRFLKFLKTRGQDSWDGSHQYRIVPRLGLQIWPRSSELLRREVDQRESTDTQSLVPFSVDSSLNNLFFSSRDSIRGGVFRGSSTLLYGEDETKKNVVAIRFLQSANSDLPNLATGLLISCGTSKRAAEEVVHSCWIHNGNMTTGKPEDILIIEGPGIYESVDEFLFRVREAIANHPISVVRAVLDDEAAIMRNGQYAHPLRELLSKRNITSLYVRTVDSSVDDKNREAYDTIIRTRHVTLPTGQNRIAYRLLKHCGSSPVQLKSMELQCPLPNAKIIIRRSFDFYEERANGTLTTIPWHLRLYFPSDDRAEYWSKEVSSLFSSVYAGQDAPNIQAFGRNEADSVFQAVIDLPDDYPLTATEVINFDDYWAAALSERDRLVPLPSVIPEQMIRQLKSSMPDWVWHSVPRCNNTDRELGIPHHLDFGIYTVRRDLLLASGYPLATRCLNEGSLPTFTWEEMKEMYRYVSATQSRLPTRAERFALEAAGISDERSVDRLFGNTPTRQVNLIGFDTSANRIDESFLCFVLEVISPFITNGRWDINSGPVFDIPQVSTALHGLAMHLRELNWQPPLGNKPAMGTETGHSDATSPVGDLTIPSGPLFQRHWFVSLWWQLRENPELRDHIAIVAPPTLNVNGDPKQAKTCRGHWYLGVVNGSGDLLRAASALRTLTSEVACSNLFHRELGLPPLQHLLNAGTLLGLNLGKLSSDLFQNSFSRGEILNYHNIRTVCTILFRDFFSRSGSRSMASDDVSRFAADTVSALDAAIREQSRNATI